MKKFRVFLLGFVCTLTVIGAAVAWFLLARAPSPDSEPKQALVLPQAPESTESKSEAASVFVEVAATPAANVPANTPPQGVFLAGGPVILPKQLQKVMEKYPDATMTLSMEAPAVEYKGKVHEMLLEGRNLVGLKFPYSFHHTLSPASAAQLREQGTAVLTVRAVICFDRPKGALCRLAQRPNIFGGMVIRATLPKDSKAPVELRIPPLVLHNLERKADPAACAQSGGTIAGAIEPTTKLLGSLGHARDYAVIAMPAFAGRPGAPYVSFDEVSTPLTPEQLAKAGEAGIVISHVQITGPGRVPVVIKIPEAFRAFDYRLLARACADGETPETCALRAFPFKLASRHNGKDGSLIALPPKDFSMAQCGERDKVFYLHAWDPDARPATSETVSAANPPEVIEGAFY